jgi:hypothetical protein
MARLVHILAKRTGSKRSPISKPKPLPLSFERTLTMPECAEAPWRLNFKPLSLLMNWQIMWNWHQTCRTDLNLNDLDWSQVYGLVVAEWSCGICGQNMASLG